MKDDKAKSYTNSFTFTYNDGHTVLKLDVTQWYSYLMPKTLSSRNPPKKQRTTLGQEYQAYSCMNSLVFRLRS